MQQKIQISTQAVFIPKLPVERITAKHTLGRLEVATKSEPDRICGTARRVGYTGKEADDLAIYRVKIKTGKERSFFTIPRLFVVKDGIFQDYEQWKRKCDQGSPEAAD
jgi:hypothetical protein